MPNCTCTSFMSSSILQILSTNKYPQLQRKMLWNKEKINCICLEWSGTNSRLINTCYLCTGPPPLSMYRYWALLGHCSFIFEHHGGSWPPPLQFNSNLTKFLYPSRCHGGFCNQSVYVMFSLLCIFVKLWNNSWSWIRKIAFHHQHLNIFQVETTMLILIIRRFQLGKGL